MLAHSAHILIFLNLICLAVSPAGAYTDSDAKLNIFENGTAKIYFAVDAKEMSQWAASDGSCPVERGGAMLPDAVNDFRRVFKLMTGSALPQNPQEGLIPLKLVYDASLCKTLGPQDYQITVTPKEIIISATRRLGLINGIYGMLDSWGCRWPMSGKIGECIPTLKLLELPMGTYTTHLGAESTTMYCYRAGKKGINDSATDIHLWTLRNRMGYDEWMTSQHYWNHAMPPEKYFAKHPEYYSLIGGKRVPTQLCTTNPEVIKIMAQKAREFFKEHPAAASFPMDSNDNMEHCQCPSCRAVDPAGTWEGQPLLTDRVILFANNVAEAIEKDYPDKSVALYAYTNHTQPPVKLMPRKNVSVTLTRANYCLLHLVPAEDCSGPGSPAAWEELLKRWLKVTPNIYWYEYNPISWTAQLPCPIYLGQAEVVKRNLKLGCKSRYEDGAFPGDISVFPNAYLPLRCLVDPSLSPQAELEKTCDAFYGPAGSAMTRYYMTLAKATEFKHPGRQRVDVTLLGYDELFNPEMIKSARDAISDAIQQTPEGSIYRKRVLLTKTVLRYLEAYLQGVWQAKAGNYSASAKSFDVADWCINDLYANGVFGDPDDAHNRIKTARLKTHAQYFSDKLGFVRKWNILGPFNNDNIAGIVSVNKIEMDAKPEFKGSVTMADGQKASWKEYESPEGQMVFSDAFTKFPADWKFGYAYAGIRIESPVQQNVQLRFSSFNGNAVFLNGRQIYNRTGLDADSPDKTIVPVTLNSGANTILVKVCQTVENPSFKWGFYFRITDVNGNPVKNIRYVSPEIMEQKK